MAICNACGGMLTCLACDQKRVQQLEETIQRLSAALLVQQKRLGVQKAGTVITISISLILAIDKFVIQLMPHIIGNPPIVTPAAFVDSAGQIKPHGRFIAAEFSVDKPSEEISVKADVDCQNCRDKPLTMFLMDKEQRQYGGSPDKSPHEQTYGLEKYTFDSPLRRGRYSLVFVNSSDNYVVVKVRATVVRR